MKSWTDWEKTLYFVVFSTHICYSINMNHVWSEFGVTQRASLLYRRSSLFFSMERNVILSGGGKEGAVAPHWEICHGAQREKQHANEPWRQLLKTIISTSYACCMGKWTQRCLWFSENGVRHLTTPYLPPRWQQQAATMRLASWNKAKQVKEHTQMSN